MSTGSSHKSAPAELNSYCRGLDTRITQKYGITMCSSYTICVWSSDAPGGRLNAEIKKHQRLAEIRKIPPRKNLG